jgi:hypothetical protein
VHQLGVGGAVEGGGVTEGLVLGEVHVEVVDGVVDHVHLDAVSPVVGCLRLVNQDPTRRRLDERTVTCNGKGT